MTKSNKMPSVDHIIKVLADELNEKTITVEPQVKYIDKNSPTLTLEEAQKFIGGHVQLVKLIDGRKILVDEDAKFKTPRPSINKEATDIVNKSGTYVWMIDVLGKAIVIEKGVRKGGW